MTSTKDCHLGIRIDCTLKKKLEQAATMDDRTVSKYVERVLIAHIEKVGKRKRR